MTRVARRVHANANGGFTVDLAEEERDLLRLLPQNLIRSLERVDGPVPDTLRRLFPPAYLGDEGAEADFVEFARADLLAAHREALGVLRDTCDATELAYDEAGSWLTAIGELRLVLGTELGVTEDERRLDPADPNYFEWTCYYYLSQLQEELVDALTALLPAASGDEPLPDDPWGAPPGGLRWDGTSRPEGP